MLDTRNLKNIKLELSMSGKGEERKLKAENDTLMIDFGEMLGGKLDWDVILRYMTPTLPGKVIKPEDKWTEKIKAKRFEATIPVSAAIDINHKAVKFENFEGKQCLVVNSDMNSVLNDNCAFMGSTWKLDGNISGNITWYFDIAQGVLVKMVVEDKSEGKIASPDGTMDATYKQSTKIEFKLKS
ncbi:MAG: hypothetical protein C0594_06010 [Marinilabiliales bacterium]|nr:MAG: hypothetical protein C0594_06010 [Marinilabiliales bacterium]